MNKAKLERLRKAAAKAGLIASPPMIAYQTIQDDGTVMAHYTDGTTAKLDQPVRCKTYIGFSPDIWDNEE